MGSVCGHSSDSVVPWEMRPEAEQVGSVCVGSTWMVGIDVGSVSGVSVPHLTLTSPHLTSPHLTSSLPSPLAPHLISIHLISIPPHTPCSSSRASSTASPHLTSIHLNFYHLTSSLVSSHLISPAVLRRHLPPHPRPLRIHGPFCCQPRARQAGGVGGGLPHMGEHSVAWHGCVGHSTW